MASPLTQKVVGDLGSQEVAQLVSNYNALLDVVGDLVTTLTGVADIAAVKAAAVIAETAIAANVKVLEQVPNVRLSPAQAAS